MPSVLCYIFFSRICAAHPPFLRVLQLMVYQLPDLELQYYNNLNMREVAFRLLHDYIFFFLYLIWCMFLLPVNEFPVLQLGFKPNQPHAEKRHRCSPMLWPLLFLFFFFGFLHRT
uniref:Uncharacterized protein n=1 Tax=Ixodes scapularis TaxID=6945 RepID=A0A4D5RWQ3_IXOSC